MPENNISASRSAQAPVVLRTQGQAVESTSPPPRGDSYVGSVPRASEGIYKRPVSRPVVTESRPTQQPNYTRPVYNHRDHAVKTVQSNGTCCPCCNS